MPTLNSRWGAALLRQMLLSFLFAILALPVVAQQAGFDDDEIVPYGGFTFRPPAAPAPLTAAACPPALIDFEGLPAGTVFKSTIAGDDTNLQHVAGVHIYAFAGDTGGNPRRAMIFDTANPTGGDTDLQTPGTGTGNTTPRGNVLIISEDNDESDPDDNASGGYLVFYYDKEVTVESVGLLDIDGGETGTITVYDSGGNQIGGALGATPLGNNSYEEVTVNRNGVRWLAVQFSGSGAVAEVNTACDPTADLLCTPDTPTGFLEVENLTDPNADPEPGDQLRITAPFANAGPDATTASVTAYFPTAKFSFVSATGSPTVDESGDVGTLVFSLGTLANGDTDNVVFTLEVDATAGGAGSIFAEVTAAAAADPDSAPDNLDVQFDGSSGNLFANGTSEDDNCSVSFSALPVELVSFTAQLDGRSATLQWETASETNNAGFEVEHRLAGAPSKDWRRVGFVAGRGTTLEAQRYAYAVPELEAGRHVFRLRQIDYDGTFAYSPEVEIAVELPEAYVVSGLYPNPFNPQAQLSFGVKRGQQVEVSLYNVLGQRVRVLFSGQVGAEETRTLTVEGSGLESGTYVLRVVGEHFTDTQLVTLIK
ncbi:MAG: T9SS type A sorting domain-containing protein [Rhodothermales bacterium]|nr:T9SS type A sorting domain-containing protein [Rhodothermales bacterium]